MRVLTTFARWFTEDADAILPALRAELGRDADVRFALTDEVEIVNIGRFCIVAGPSEALAPFRDTIGPVVVEDLDEARATLERSGSTISREERTAPTGRLLYARHADGTEVEYLECNPTSRKRLMGDGPDRT